MGGRVYLNFASDDYLDLATDPRLARAAARASLRYGCGAGASPAFTGSLPPHRSLERALARREGAEACLVFENSFIANLVLIGTLVGPKDVVFCDAFSFPGLMDVCALSGATVHYYRNSDLRGLGDLLRKHGSRRRRRLIVTDTLFGTSGLVAPLTDIAGLAERYDALVVADESHAAGVLGKLGRGLLDSLSEQTPGRHRVLKTSTLSKAYGSQGGFVCGPRKFLTVLSRHSALATSSVALAVPAAAAARRAVLLADQEPDRRRRVLTLANHLRELLQLRGFPAGPSRAQIVPVTVGDPRLAQRMSRQLQKIGLLVPAVGPPLVPAGMARLRISLTAGHTDADVDHLIDALSDTRSAED
jgi:7-keto-8-aminopelargonate synthetase-like enzyme